MSKKRVAHTVDIIRRLLHDAETGDPEPIALIGLWDELSRLERKWRLQWADRSPRRRPEHIDQLNGYFDRLQSQITRTLRRADDPALRQVLDQIAGRSRTW